MIYQTNYTHLRYVCYKYKLNDLMNVVYDLAKTRDKVSRDLTQMKQMKDGQGAGLNDPRGDG